MIKQITIGVYALALGMAFASAPASAQQAHYGKALNDGGMVDDSSMPAPKRLYNAATPAPAATPHYGKALNDGGMTDQPSAAQLAANARIKWVQSQPHYGKAMNDGGF
jgi:hypothetical protein